MSMTDNCGSPSSSAPCSPWAAALLTSTLAARAYLSQRLTLKNADNATALALALSQKQPDAIDIELTAAALFDSSNYELVRVTDPEGKTIVERRARRVISMPGMVRSSLSDYRQPRRGADFQWLEAGRHCPSGQPQPLRLPGAVVKHAGDDCGVVWPVWFGGYLGALVLRRLRQPSERCHRAGAGYFERRFITIEEPDVPELKQLATAMNATVTRLKDMFEEAGRLEAVRREANSDALTGLANHQLFHGPPARSSTG
ncbi:MAG: hypothetical protein IPL58_14845 [Betaproteobacteria bacterium]|uniref:LapD/MoxY periplasmic domain-containing protein n=1 Tax=Candidatus Proximibacter danicus TaxID=2954365 RepID=A0A9D7PT14_9PROT|nr:hypothetical protein [Candidatus Proximibacter danicus]